MERKGNISFLILQNNFYKMLILLFVKAIYHENPNGLHFW
jgi:hypothetical protein